MTKRGKGRKRKPEDNNKSDLDAEKNGKQKNNIEVNKISRCQMSELKKKKSKTIN